MILTMVFGQGFDNMIVMCCCDGLGNEFGNDFNDNFW
jgi:hypothetical protein